MATSKAREKENEAYLVKVAKRHGGMAEQFTSPSKRSVPDRVCTIPCWEPTVQMVEVKAEGEDATDAQKRDHERRRKPGGFLGLHLELRSRAGHAAAVRFGSPGLGPDRAPAQTEVAPKG